MDVEARRVAELFEYLQQNLNEDAINSTQMSHFSLEYIREK